MANDQAADSRTEADEDVSDHAAAPWLRAPAVPVAACLSAGVLIDRFAGLPLTTWLALAGVSLAAWGVTYCRNSRCAVGLLLLAAVLAGGGWHRLARGTVTANHVMQYVTDDVRPVHLRGQVHTVPWVSPARNRESPIGPPQYDRTICMMACASLISGQDEFPVSGLVRLEVTGHLLGVRVGDEIEVFGRWTRPRGARNPGGFDFRRYLADQGVHVIVRCKEPDDVLMLQSAADQRAAEQGSAIDTLLRIGQDWQQWIRARYETLLKRSLSESNGAVGVALLLGSRGGMSDELRAAFAESGTMHILAISGTNVAILAGLLWFLCRVLHVGRKIMLLTVLTGIVAYALIADAQPPVLRAVLMIVTIVAGRTGYRQGSLANGLAVAIIGVLLYNPAHLFDVGAQLSFLAVGALIWGNAWWRTWKRAEPDLEKNLATPSTWERACRTMARGLLRACQATAAVWLFTLPLTMARFSLLSLVGFAINIVLAPLVLVILWCGYTLMVVGLLLPPLAKPFVLGLDYGLSIMQWLVQQAARLPAGHVYLAGPADWWLAGFYATLLIVICGTPLSARCRAVGWRLMLLWTVIGLLQPLELARPPELRCTFLAVGHGGAILIELPGGKTLLYDAGQLQDGTRAQQIVQAALWECGRSSIDAVVLSHADIDHFNGVEGLLMKARIGSVVMHPTFLDTRQTSVRLLSDALRDQHVPVRLVWSGDRLQVDDSVVVQVLQPGCREDYGEDNANSLVLCVEYAGRRILLTGDLEGAGTRALVASPRQDIDVLLAPHHGSLGANTRELADWSTPEWVIISGGQRETAQRLRTIFAEPCQILSTQVDGAITFSITADGLIRCQPLRSLPGVVDGPAE